MRRGRPRHDDVLTPREWEVLDLLREGLTNEQIAVRLGISYDTAKFHVSEILGKLGVESRREAALWPGRPKVAFGLAPLLAFFGGTAPRRLAAGLIGATAVVLGLLAAGVVIMESRDDDDGPAAVASPSVTQQPPTGTPAPTTTPGPTATPDSATREPPYAPDGRTGNLGIDPIIETVLTADAATLAERFGRAEVRAFLGPPVDEWAQRLAASQRELYAVYAREVHQDVYFAVAAPDGTFERWRFVVQFGNVLDIDVASSRDYNSSIPADQVRRLVMNLPDLGRHYAGYLVLPPPYDLPQPPPMHALSTRTGEPAVDAVLALIEADDAAGLVDLVRDPDALRVRPCDSPDRVESRAYVEEWARRAVGRSAGIDAVARVPDGFFPASDYVVVLAVQADRFWWQAMGVFLDDGEIVMVVEGDGCTRYPDPGSLTYYPAYVAPGQRDLLIGPPVNGTEGLEPSRNGLRTGVAVVDAVLDAAVAGDRETLADLIAYSQQPCGTFEYAPPCPEGVPAGTPVDILPFAACHGGGVFPEEAPDTVIEMFQESYVYAVGGRTPDPLSTPGSGPADGYTIVLADPEGGSVRSIGIGPEGVRSLRGVCGAQHPEWSIGGGEPDYVLAPI